MRKRIRLKKLMTAALALALLTAFTLPFAAAAEEAEQKVVRVGWFDSSFCYRDQFGRRCGIDYEYQHKISAYTGWTYEYVEDSWPNLLQKLMDGQIDLLSDVSYKPEREEYILYPDLPMGSETYYIYIDGENREITADNPASFNGKRIGVNQGSVQEGFLRDWAEKNGVSLEILPLTTEEDESMNMVTRGQIDGFASIYTYGSEQRVVPSCRIGASDYYYAVNRNRPDLLAELNAALAGIHEEDPNFNEKVSEGHLYNEKMNILLTPDQEDWLVKHGTVRVGYVENYMPFCGTDSETGELTGALRDFLTHAQNNLRDSEIRFETKAYATTAEALAAMKNGEIDCVFPVYMSTYDCDEMDIRLTKAAMKTGMNAITRGSDSQNLSRDSELTFAVSAGNPNVETFMMDEYPGCRRLTFPNEKACFDAVASGLADCLLVSNYRIPEFEETIRENKFYSVPTGEHIPLSFAVKQADRELYFLLNKTVLTTKSEDMDSALASYMHTSKTETFGQFLLDHWIIVLISVSAVFLIIVFLLLKQMKAQRKAHEQERLLEEAAEIADLKETISSLLDNMPGMSFTKDANTGAYLACNQAFADYAGRKEPNDVIGHTDTELFDAETAKRLAEDDRMALAMEEPYIYFEEAQDDDGKQRQIKTTKLKYTDATGRLCVMGIFQDVTDSLRIRRTTAATRESYERAKGTGVMYAHIAQALAR